MATGQGINLVIFDFDGVMIDTELLHYRLWRQQFARHDLLLTTDDWAELRGQVGVGGERRDISTVLCQRAGLDLDAEAVRRGVRATYARERDQLPMRAGIDGWIHEARDLGMRCAIVTNAEGLVVDAALRRWRVRNSFAFVVDRRSAGLRKPSPAGYHEVLRRAEVSPERVIAIEDSLDGVAAARAARIAVLATPHKATGHLLEPGPRVAVVDPRWVSFAAATRLLAEEHPPVRQDRSTTAQRITASARGLALGDALGKLIDKRSSASLDGQTLALIGQWRDQKSPAAVFRGRITDDTVLTLTVAETMIKRTAIRRDIVEQALRRVNPNGGRQVYKMKNSADRPPVAQDGDSNGCVPRATAVAWIHGDRSLGDLLYDSLKLTTLTHGHPDAVALALLQSFLGGQAIAGRSRSDAVETSQAILPSVRRIVGRDLPVLDLWCQEVTRVATAANAQVAVKSLVARHGLSVKARSSALVALVLATTPFDLVDVFSALMTEDGGDLDSTMAIYGAIAGAFHPESVPASWTDRIEEFSKLDLTKLGCRLAEAMETG